MSAPTSDESELPKELADKATISETNDEENEEQPPAAQPDGGETEALPPPTAVLVILGELLFEPSGETELLSVKITSPEERGPTLEAAKERVADESLDSLHVVLRGSSLSSLYDDSVLITFRDSLKPGKEAIVHVLGSADAPLQPADVADLRMSLVLAGLKLEQEAATPGDGGWQLLARKPGPPTIDEEDEDEEADEDDNDEAVEP